MQRCKRRYENEGTRRRKRDISNRSLPNPQPHPVHRCPFVEDAEESDHESSNRSSLFVAAQTAQSFDEAAPSFKAPVANMLIPGNACDNGSFSFSDRSDTARTASVLRSTVFPEDPHDGALNEADLLWKQYQIEIENKTRRRMTVRSQMKSVLREKTQQTEEARARAGKAKEMLCETVRRKIKETKEDTFEDDEEITQDRREAALQDQKREEAQKEMERFEAMTRRL